MSISEKNFDGQYVHDGVHYDCENGTGGTPDVGNIRYKGFVMVVTPGEFLSLCYPLPADAVRPKSAAFFDRCIRDGIGISPPALYIDLVDETASRRGPWIQSHEGRHRVQAMARAGVKEVTVQVHPLVKRARHMIPSVLSTLFAKDWISETKTRVRVRPLEIVIDMPKKSNRRKNFAGIPRSKRIQRQITGRDLPAERAAGAAQHRWLIFSNGLERSCFWPFDDIGTELRDFRWPKAWEYGGIALEIRYDSDKMLPDKHDDSIVGYMHEFESGKVGVYYPKGIIDFGQPCPGIPRRKGRGMPASMAFLARAEGWALAPPGVAWRRYEDFDLDEAVEAHCDDTILMASPEGDMLIVLDGENDWCPKAVFVGPGLVVERDGIDD